MSVILYGGSGPTAPQDSIFMWAEKGQPAKPFPVREYDRLAFSSISPDKRAILSVAFQDGDPRLVMVDLQSRAVTVLLSQEGGADRAAIYFPKLSPSGDRIAYLETPGVGYPPRWGAPAVLKLLALENNIWVPVPFDVPSLLAPFDWGPEELALIHQDQEGRLVRSALDGAHDTAILAPTGQMPLWSPKGTCLAFRDEGGIRVITGTDRLEFPMDGEITALGWGLDERTLLVAVTSGFWRTDVCKVDVQSRHVETIFTMPEVQFLTMIPREV